ncbi:MAG: 50S ribosomal protein L30e [Candidatus Baldrarchaeia archaeon]
MVNLEKSLKMALKTGKVILGSKRTLDTIRRGRAKLIILAKEAPEEIKQEVMYYCKLSKTPLYVFEGSSVELGALCGKPFMVSSLAIIDPGDSDILKLVEESE